VREKTMVDSKSSKNRKLTLAVVAGVLLLVIGVVLGYIIPAWGWLAGLGVLLLWVALWLRFMRKWIPPSPKGKERDKEIFSPPPSTMV
jgi:uncharacterized membrane protein